MHNVMSHKSEQENINESNVSEETGSSQFPKTRQLHAFLSEKATYGNFHSAFT